jgi:hypothetical protein
MMTEKQIHMMQIELMAKPNRPSEYGDFATDRRPLKRLRKTGTP